MELSDFTNADEDFADRPWQAIGEIVDGLIRSLLAEAGQQGAARGTGEVVGPPRAKPVVKEGEPTGERVE